LSSEPRLSPLNGHCVDLEELQGGEVRNDPPDNLEDTDLARQAGWPAQGTALSGPQMEDTATKDALAVFEVCKDKPLGGTSEQTGIRRPLTVETGSTAVGDNPLEGSLDKQSTPNSSEGTQAPLDEPDTLKQADVDEQPHDELLPATPIQGKDKDDEESADPAANSYGSYGSDEFYEEDEFEEDEENAEEEEKGDEEEEEDEESQCFEKSGSNIATPVSATARSPSGSSRHSRSPSSTPRSNSAGNNSESSIDVPCSMSHEVVSVHDSDEEA